MFGVRPGQALGEAGDDRIGAVGVDDRHRQAQRLDLEHRLALDDDQVDRQAHQLVGERGAPCSRRRRRSGSRSSGCGPSTKPSSASEVRNACTKGTRLAAAAPSASRCARCAAAAARGAARQEAARRGGKEEFTSSHGEHRVGSGFVAGVSAIASMMKAIFTNSRRDVDKIDDADAQRSGRSALWRRVRDENAKRRHRTVEALQDELAGGSHAELAVEQAADALRHQDLAAARLAAQARREVGDGADRAVVDPARESRCRRSSRSPGRCRRPSPARSRAAPSRPRGGSTSRCIAMRHARGARRRIGDRHRVVEEDHDAVAGEALERAFVLEDERGRSRRGIRRAPPSRLPDRRSR